jgi:hypothetical protein
LGQSRGGPFQPGLLYFLPSIRQEIIVARQLSKGQMAEIKAELDDETKTLLAMGQEAQAADQEARDLTYKAEKATGRARELWEAYYNQKHLIDRKRFEMGNFEVL